MTMHTGIWSNTLSDYLDDDELEDFQDLVMRDIKSSRTSKKKENYNTFVDAPTKDELQELRDNKHIWLYCLRIVRRELELQMSHYKTEKLEKQLILSASNDEDEIEEIKDWLLVKSRWRNQAMKMLSVVEQKVIYIKMMQEQDTTK